MAPDTLQGLILRLFMNSLIGLVACYNSLMLEMPEREWNAKFSLKNGTAGGN